MLKLKEKAIEGFLALCGLITIFTTLGIIVVLATESVGFFREVSFVEFFTGTEWTPLFANKKFGILPLVSGTFLTTA
ncbi:MAG TPA: phosphate ABC transporter permease subunit PstC, partial [Sphingobacteriaceae bacterium]